MPLFSKVYKCQTGENSRCLLAKRSAGGLEDEIPENEAPENQVPVLESQTASENADINVGVSTPAVIHFAYLSSINNIIDIDGIVNFLK